MKSLKKTSLFILLAAFALIFTSLSTAEERDIYIGDLVELKITTREFTEDEIREKFKEFEIVGLKSIPEGFIITLRTFEPGEKIVDLGNSEIIITVKSTLDEIDRNELFEGNPAAESAGFTINFNYLFYASAAVFFVSGALLAAQYIKKRRDLSLTPYVRFKKRIDKVSADDGDYLVKLTMYFREYLESRFSLIIKGKTSTEMMGEISPTDDLRPFTGEIGNWLNESDYYKFSGNAATRDKKLELLAGLKEIVSKIEQVNEGKA